MHKRVRTLITGTLLASALVVMTWLPAGAYIPRWPEPSWFAQFGQTTPAPAPAPGQAPEVNQPVPVSAPQPAPAPHPATVQVTADEQKVLDLINRERAKAGLPALEMDTRLVFLARQKSQDMVDNKYFGHNSPTYGSAYDMMRAAGLKYRYAAENLARHSNVTYAHMLLMESSTHRSKILSTHYSQVGIGIVRTRTGGIMMTQMFIGQ